MPFLQSVCLGLRLATLFLVSLVGVREHIPGSVDRREPVVPITDTVRYERGELGWHEYRDDVMAIDKKMEMCEKNAINESFGRRLGCSVQRKKLAIWRFHLVLFKDFVGFLVGQYESLTGPYAVLHFIKLVVLLAAFVTVVYNLVAYRSVICNFVYDLLQRPVNYFLPPIPQPPQPVPISPPYISEATRAFLMGVQNEAVGSVSSSSVRRMDHYEGGDPRLYEDSASELDVRPRGSFHGMSSDEASDYAMPSRSLPRRRQSYPSVDDYGPVDDIDALGVPAAREIYRPDSRGFDTDDGAEPVTRKKVAFQDDVIEDRTGRGKRRPPEPREEPPRSRVPQRAGREPRGRRGVTRRQPTEV